MMRAILIKMTWVLFEHLTLYQANTSNDLATPRQDLLQERVRLFSNNVRLGKISCRRQDRTLEQSCLVKSCSYVVSPGHLEPSSRSIPFT